MSPTTSTGTKAANTQSPAVCAAVAEMLSERPLKLAAMPTAKLAAGASECFEHIGSATVQRVNAEFALRRRQFKKAKLRWRVSRGAKRSLGWIPFKAAPLKRKGKSLRFACKAIRGFAREL